MPVQGPADWVDVDEPGDRQEHEHAQELYQTDLPTTLGAGVEGSNEAGQRRGQ